MVVPEETSQPRPLTTADIPTIVNALLEAWPPVTRADPSVRVSLKGGMGNKETGNRKWTIFLRGALSIASK